MEAKDKIRVVMADRDASYMKKVKACLEKQGTVQVVGITDSGDRLLSMIRELRPDVVLMDVLLTEKDGIWVLESLKAQTAARPICIMVSAFDSDKIVRQVIALGAEYYMAKPIQSEILLSRIEQSVIHSETSLVSPAQAGVPGMLQPNTHIRNLEAEISSLISRMGISASIKGYHYIRKAVMMAVAEEEILIGITKGLYPDIAKFYKTTASKVERAIRHAIESSWGKNGKEVFFEFAGYYTQSKPTNGQFIAAMSEYFRLNQNSSQKRTA